MSQLIERAVAAIELGRRTGAKGSHPSNIYNIAEELVAALTQPSPNPTAAEGSVLVPVEPTDAMLEAGANIYDGDMRKQHRAYRAMLASRPSIGEPVPGAGGPEIAELLEASRKALIVTGPEIKAKNQFVWERLSNARIAVIRALPAPLASTQEGEAP
jgi:hypothetical protein